MEGLFQLIKSKCSDEGAISIVKCKPPSYVAVFLKGKYLGDIILVSKKDSTDVSFAIEGCDDSTSNDTHDVTGNPLEAPFSDISLVNDLTVNLIGDSKVTEMPQGVSTVLARTITSLYNTKGPDTCLPIWVVCDGKTADHRGGHIRLMHAEKRDGLICVGVAVDLGPTNSETNPRDLIAKLDQTADRIRGLRNWDIACAYNFNPGGALSNSCRLSMTWRQLDYRPPTNSRSLDVNVEVECQPRSDSGSPTQFLWDQFLLLTSYTKLLNTEGHPPSLKLPSSADVLLQLPKSSESPLEKLKAALSETDVQIEAPIEDKEYLASLISTLSSPKGQEFDLLGKLWFILIECSTLKDLSECLFKLNIELKDGRLESHIHQIVSALTLSQGTLTDPLNHLIELGIEKLKKDVLAIFAEAEIYPCLPSLNRFSNSMGDEWRLSVDKSVRWLAESLCLFDVLVSVERALSIPIKSTQSLAADFRSQISQWHRDGGIDGFISDQANNLRGTIPSLSVAKLLNERCPDEWLMTISEKKSDSYELRSEFFYGTMRPLVPHYDHLATACFDQTDVNIDFQQDHEHAKLWSAARHTTVIKKPIV
ncbi:Uncharacterized conserved protein (DUF2352) [Nesidiocoris tenuis]|uniref:Protein zwilch n=1 Tax=Nesidiocoris tenuis TaxID=355587 RepID=A0ABN7AR50_9HEMI|nr:Uncharacterized conserved protein (DUF2352) [Nesidiocoris tenuis]